MRARVLALAAVGAILLVGLWRLTLHQVPFDPSGAPHRAADLIPSPEINRFESTPPAPSGEAADPVPPTRARIHDRELFVVDASCIAGIVIDPNEKPVPGASVVVYNADTGTSRTASDEAGQFAVCQLKSDVYRVSASAPRFSERVSENVRVGTTGLTLELEPAGSISGRVIDEITGQSISAYTVALLESRPGLGASEWGDLVVNQRVRWLDSRAAWGDFPPVTYGHDASFTIYEVPEGKPVAIAARAEGYAPAFQMVGPVGSGEQVTGVTIPLVAGGRIDGSLLASDGHAIEGASIYLGKSAEGLATRSDAAGTFTLTGLIPGEWVVLAKHPEFESAAKSVHVFSGATSQLRMTLNHGGTIEGTVRIGERPAVSRVVRIMISLAEHGLDLPPVETFTDGMGRYRVSGLSPGMFLVLVTDESENEGARSLQREAAVESGLVTAVDFRFPNQSAAIEGVVMVRGAPAPRVEINGKVRSEEGERIFRVEADESGYFCADGLPSGAAQLEVTVVDPTESSHRRSATFQVPEGAVVRQDFAFDGAATIRGSVANWLEGETGEAILFDAETDLRLERFEELLALYERPIAQTQLTESGTFALEGIDPGSYKLVVFAFQPGAGEEGNVIDTLRTGWQEISVGGEGLEGIEVQLGTG